MAMNRLPMNCAQVLAGLVCLGASSYDQVCMADDDRLTVKVALDQTSPQESSDQMYVFLCPSPGWTGLQGITTGVSEQIPSSGSLTFSLASAVNVFMYVYWLPDGMAPMTTCPGNPAVGSEYRLQLIELTYHTPGGKHPQNMFNTCDVSCVDYYGLPVSLTWGSETAAFNTDDATIQQTLLNLVNPSSSDLDSVLMKTASGDFLRFVSPKNVHSTANPPAYWDPSPYMDYMFTKYGEANWPSLITTQCPNSTNANACATSAQNSYSFTASLVADPSGNSWESIQLTGNLGLPNQGGGPWNIVTGPFEHPGQWECAHSIPQTDTVTMTLPKEQFTNFFYTNAVSIWSGMTASGYDINLALSCCNPTQFCAGGATSVQQCCHLAIASFANGLALGMAGSVQHVSDCNVCQTSSEACQLGNEKWFTKLATGPLQVSELSSQEWKRCFSACSDNWGPSQPFYNQYADVIFKKSGGTIYGMPVADEWKAANPLTVMPVDGTNPLHITIDSISVTPPSPAVGDVNGDGVVDSDDIAALMTNLGFRRHDSDFDRDVDGEDLGLLLGSWGYYGDDKP